MNTKIDSTSLGHFIGGAEVADGLRTADVTNPATGQVIRRISLATATTVEQAVAAAAAAFPAWRSMPPLKRVRLLVRFKELLERDRELLAALVSEEHGKTLDDALGEFQRGLENVDYACSAPELLKGEFAGNVGPGIHSWSDFQPLGVVVGITPFNFPLMVPMWMFPMALACGNCFVLKPSERDPSPALAMARLLHEAGLPDGVFNVVNGDKEAVDALLANPRVQAVSFVGSTPVAQHVYETGTRHGKRVQALGGAKNHALIMPDADMDQAAGALMGAAYGSCGERCMAISVAVAVGDAVADALVARLERHIERLAVGPGMGRGIDMGPLITRQHLDKVRSYVDLGLREGATLLADGRDLVVPGADHGFFLGACLFDHVQPHMRIYREEIFGPVLCVIRVQSQAEGMALIDSHEYGNGACIFTRDGEAARLFADTVQAGMIGINVPVPVPVAVHSFGGWKRSFFGDLCAHGPDSVRFYTRRKTITQRWPGGGVRESSSYAFPS